LLRGARDVAKPGADVEHGEWLRAVRGLRASGVGAVQHPPYLSQDGAAPPEQAVGQCHVAQRAQGERGILSRVVEDLAAALTRRREQGGEERVYRSNCA
jgi:hypothetical protein